MVTSRGAAAPLPDVQGTIALEYVVVKMAGMVRERWKRVRRVLVWG